MRTNAAKVPVVRTPGVQTTRVRATRVIAAGEFKAKCLGLLDEVNQGGQEIQITKRGKLVARLVPPAKTAAAKSGFGMMRGTAVTLGDIVGPIDVEWDANE